jgi:type IV pilus assembly protein PilW
MFLTVTATREGGYSIVELMVAVTVSLLIMAGLTTLFVENSRARAELERSNAQLENGRYAIDLLSGDLRNAGYLAEFDPRALATPATLPDPCATDVTTLKTAVPLHVQGVDDGGTVPACLSDVLAGTDILVVRRAATCVAGTANCDDTGPYFQTTLCSDELEGPGAHYDIATNRASLTNLHKRDCSTVADVSRYLTHIYFVAADDNAGDRIPTLKRAELGSAGFTVVPLVEGIENMQIEYGVDRPTIDGTPDAYVTSPATPEDWRRVVAVKVHLLARSTDRSPGYTDEKTYTLGLNSDGTAKSVGPFGDGYKRHVFESLVRLNNPAGRNLP